MIRRGQIYWINLDPTIGTVIQKTRPCVIVSNDVANRYSTLVTVVPVSSNVSKPYPFEVLLNAGDGGLKKQSLAKINQMKAVDIRRLSSEPLGTVLSPQKLQAIDRAIRIHLGLQ